MPHVAHPDNMHSNIFLEMQLTLQFAMITAAIYLSRHYGAEEAHCRAAQCQFWQVVCCSLLPGVLLDPVHHLNNAVRKHND